VTRTPPRPAAHQCHAGLHPDGPCCQTVDEDEGEVGDDVAAGALELAYAAHRIVGEERRGLGRWRWRRGSHCASHRETSRDVDLACAKMLGGLMRRKVGLCKRMDKLETPNYCSELRWKHEISQYQCGFVILH
jgi:hypothetical protein